MTDAVVEAGEASIRTGSKSFAIASRLFGREMREDAWMLYAWCRHCDDVVDGQVAGFAAGQNSGETPQQRLDALFMQTRRALSGTPMPDPVFTGFARVAARHRIPQRYPLELLQGFAMDVEGAQYRTLDDTLRYSYHVAGVVGIMMALVMGVPPEAKDTLDRACDLGLGFQLTNIARDVLDDAALGRIYLPAEWLAEAGIPPEEIADPRHRAALAGVATRLLDAAEPLRFSLCRAGGLPPRAAWAVATARGVYREIGTRLRIQGAAGWDRRVVVPKHRKLWHVGAGGVAALTARRAAPPRRPDLWRRP
ncbi:phytoene/squalene synthase family protein [Pseudoroseomonas wenyumeiae]